MKNTLEGSKFFPYLAWSAVILFALFTYSLIAGIKESTALLTEKTKENEAAMDTLVKAKKMQLQNTTNINKAER
jgi:hypothetical protein